MGKIMKAAIIYSNYLDRNGQERRIGGIETYLFNLSDLCRKMDIEPTVFQNANKSFERIVDGIKIVGITTSSLKRGPLRRIDFFKQAARHFDTNKDMVIFGADRHSVRYGSDRCVSIQHGIAWDLPNRFLSPRTIWHNEWMGKLYKQRERWRAIRNYTRCPNRVCVDYNFLNWFRTFLPCELKGHNWVIPNFADIPDYARVTGTRKNTLELKILFARRFCDYRGTRIMTQAAKSLLKKYPHLLFTFAGEGPDESWIRDQFEGEPRVTITKYTHEQIIDVHLQHHIAVVPSLASEGTSLSVAEAMACGCAVASTAIGGITNMIIDGYNGRLCMPAAGDLEACIESLIVGDELRKQIVERAYETAKAAFSKERWEESWSQVIEVIAKQ